MIYNSAAVVKTLVVICNLISNCWNFRYYLLFLCCN